MEATGDSAVNGVYYALSERRREGGVGGVAARAKNRGSGLRSQALNAGDYASSRTNQSEPADAETNSIP